MNASGFHVHPYGSAVFYCMLQATVDNRSPTAFIGGHRLATIDQLPPLVDLNAPPIAHAADTVIIVIRSSSDDNGYV
jgi:hypothetical protein